MEPVTLAVSFVYMHERDPSYWSLPVPVELRASVTLDAAGDPDVTPLDRAVWQDALGPEQLIGGVESPAWTGAKEAAADQAVELVSQQAMVARAEFEADFRKEEAAMRRAG